MDATISEARTFDALIHADLEKVYDQGEEEDLRDRVFRVLLKRADSFDGQKGTHRDLKPFSMLMQNGD